MPSVNTTGKTGGEEGRQVRASQRRQRRNQAVTRETDWVKDTTKHRETTVWRRQKSIIRKTENDRVEHIQEHPMILLSDSLTAYRTQSETTRLLTFISEMWWLHGVHFSCSDLCASCKVELEPCEAVRQIHFVLCHVGWKTMDLPLSRLCPVHWNRTSRTEWVSVLDFYTLWRTFQQCLHGAKFKSCWKDCICELIAHERHHKVIISGKLDFCYFQVHLVNS